VSDALAAVLPDAKPDGSRENSDAGAEKLVGPALGVRAQGAPARLPEVLAPQPEEALCTRGAVRSAA
jgi:hypothetical protein